MVTKLSENIRKFRKERGLTQEQLAEVLGVTVGAVYKWEARLSQPELSMVMELADFFDTSVDVLLGYEMRDNRLEVCLARLKKYRDQKDPAGLLEAEKALKKYPNHFDIVYYSSVLYGAFGMESHDKALLRRAVELLATAQTLLAQNRDTRLNADTLYGDMAGMLLILDEAEKAVEMLRSHNAGGMYNDLIGITLTSELRRPEEAMPYLTEALLSNVASLIRVIIGFSDAYMHRQQYAQAKDILRWGIGLFHGLKRPGVICFLDKIDCLLYTCLAESLWRLGETGAARDALRTAHTCADTFDAQPNYDTCALRFLEDTESHSLYDDFGTTAHNGIAGTLRSIDNDALSAIWEEIQREAVGSQEESMEGDARL